MFHFIVGNADAHAKNIGLLYVPDGVRLAPMYDVVCTAVYPDLSDQLALAVGDELDPGKVTTVHWGDLAFDFGLRLGPFERVRRELASRAVSESQRLRAESGAEGWHDPIVDRICEVIEARAERLV
jgi:serine/threonine-protein kinase HipA